MPRLYHKRPNAAHADGVWFQDVVSLSGTIPLDVPEAGQYRAVLLKIGTTAEIAAPKKPNVRDFIGYGRRFNPEYRSTAEIMKELREGEEDFRSLYPALNIFNPVKAGI